MNTPFSTSDSLDPEIGYSAAASSVSEKAAALKDRALETAHHLRESAAEKAAALKESAAEQWQDTRVKAKEIHITAEDYIREHPTKCVLGALGAGFLIGLIVRR